MMERMRALLPRVPAEETDDDMRRRFEAAARKAHTIGSGTDHRTQPLGTQTSKPEGS